MSVRFDVGLLLAIYFDDKIPSYHAIYKYKICYISRVLADLPGYLGTYSQRLSLIFSIGGDSENSFHHLFVCSVHQASSLKFLAIFTVWLGADSAKPLAKFCHQQKGADLNKGDDGGYNIGIAQAHIVDPWRDTVVDSK